jgi:c-di-GMP-binding flagellar brake protein YcgR
MEADNNWVNKRMHPRIAWSFMVRFRLQKDDGLQGWEVSVINNISLGGCRFSSNIPFNAGEALEIEVTLPLLTEPMKFIGEVKRCIPRDDAKVKIYDIGVQFLDMDQNKKDKFIETVTFFLKKHSKIRG